MYQNLQNEYDKLQEQNENLLNIMNNKQYTNNDDTTYGEQTDNSIYDMLQSLQPNNYHNHNQNQNHDQKQHEKDQSTQDPDMTIMEIEEDEVILNHAENQNDQIVHSRQTQEFLSGKIVNNNDGTQQSEQEEDNKMEIKNDNVKNEYILKHVDNENGVSLAWDETNDEFGILERRMDSNHNKQKRSKRQRNNDDDDDRNKNKNDRDKGGGIKYIETVRGNKRNELPGHECKQCAKFYALNKNIKGLQRKNLCDHVSRHRAKHKMPDTPQGFWDIDIKTPDSLK